MEAMLAVQDGDPEATIAVQAAVIAELRAHVAELAAHKRPRTSHRRGVQQGSGVL
jgi:hypothetical protein